MPANYDSNNSLNASTTNEAFYLNKAFKLNTYDALLQEALGLVPDTLDKREGSVIYDSLAPSMYQLSKFYEDLLFLLSQTYVVSASFPYLDLRCLERNIVRNEGTKCQRIFKFTKEETNEPALDIKIGTSLSTVDLTDNIIFNVISKYLSTISTAASLVLDDFTATANFTGSSSNKVAIEIIKNATTDQYELNTYYNDILSETNIYSSSTCYNELLNNNFLIFTDCSTKKIDVLEKTYLTGGLDISQEVPGYYIGEAETVGTEANTYNNDIVILENIYKATVQIVDGPYIYGENRETDDELRARYFSFLSDEPFGGNIAHYRKWLTDDTYDPPTGIVAVQVYPVWNGGGTVLLSILADSETYSPADAILMYKAKEFLDPSTKPQKGYGIAPIGHQVTVVTPAKLNFDFSVSINFSTGTTATFAVLIKEVIEKYFLELRKTFDTIDKTNNKYKVIMQHAQLVSRILTISGINKIDDNALYWSNDGSTPSKKGDCEIESTKVMQYVPFVRTVTVVSI